MDILIVLHTTSIINDNNAHDMKKLIKSQFADIFKANPQMKIAFSGFDVEVRE